MENAKIDRILRLMLIMQRQYLTYEEISERLDITIRTAYRYIDAMKDCGFAIEKKGDRMRLIRDTPQARQFSKLINFSDEEAFVINSMIDSLVADTRMNERLKRKLSTVYNCTSILERVVDKQLATLAHEVQLAIKHKQQISVDYISASSGRSQRLLEPYQFTEAFDMVWCFDCEKKENRLFKLSRMNSLERLKSKWAYEPEHRVNQVDAFRMQIHTPHPVKLLLEEQAHQLLTEEYPISRNFITQQPDGRYLFDANVGDFAGICRFIVGLADKVEIVESDELRQYVKAFVAKNLATF